MNSWTPEAAKAIALCQAWAKKLGIVPPLKIYLFGSAIYQDGDQFDPVSSDLDVAAVFPEHTSALSRFALLQALSPQKSNLELDLIPTLGRVSCDEPAVSVVALTPLELRTNIHKSGARSFFDKNFFFELVKGKQTLGIPSAGTSSLREEIRQALEYVQRIRNEYLSVAANGMGGIEVYSGPDPMPKSLLRAAAQIVPDTAEGQWYDTRLGLEFMHEVLRKRRGDGELIAKLGDRISKRRGGRGRKRSLTAEDQLLLAELLFDEAAKSPTEDMVTWEMRIRGIAPTDENARRIGEAIAKLVPSSKVIGYRRGSVVIKARSSRGGFDVLKQLEDAKILHHILHVHSAAIWLVDGDVPGFHPNESSRVEMLADMLRQWGPRFSDSGGLLEENFDHYFREAVLENNSLGNPTVFREVQVTGTEIPYAMDYLLTWSDDDKSPERVGIELLVLRSPSSFFYKLSQILPLGRPVILVTIGSKNLLAQLSDDFKRLAQLNANVFVVQIPLELKN